MYNVRIVAVEEDITAINGLCTTNSSTTIGRALGVARDTRVHSYVTDE